MAKCYTFSLQLISMQISCMILQNKSHKNQIVSVVNSHTFSPNKKETIYSSIAINKYIVKWTLKTIRMNDKQRRTFCSSMVQRLAKQTRALCVERNEEEIIHAMLSDDNTNKTVWIHRRDSKLSSWDDRRRKRLNKTVHKQQHLLPLAHTHSTLIQFVYVL